MNIFHVQQELSQIFTWPRASVVPVIQDHVYSINVTRIISIVSMSPRIISLVSMQLRIMQSPQYQYLISFAEL